MSCSGLSGFAESVEGLEGTLVKAIPRSTAAVPPAAGANAWVKGPPGGPIHALARDAPGSHGRLIQGVSASFDHWRWAAIDSSRRRQSGVPGMSLPTPTVPVPPWLRVTSYLAFWTRLSYAAVMLRGGGSSSGEEYVLRQP